MRHLLALSLMAGLLLAHGESGRTANTGSASNTAFGGSIAPDTGSGARSGAKTVKPKEGRHTWDTWWAYNREYLLALRLRGAPTSGLRRPTNDTAKRKALREGRLTDVLVGALNDKNHRVRAAAAVALGKFGRPDTARDLERRTGKRRESWFDVREACVYGLGLLGLDENRRLLVRWAKDKERSMKERTLPLIGLLADRTQASADELEAFLKYSRAGVYATPETKSVSVEQEHRRLAAHLLGFSEHPDYDGVLSAAAMGSRKWRGAEQGLAMTALGRRGAKDQISWMFKKAYDRDIHKQARRSATIALGMLIDAGNEDQIKRLTRVIRDVKRDNTQQNFGVMALGNIGGPHAIDALIGLIDRKTFAAPGDRAFVYLALGVCGGPSKKAREFLLAKYERARSHVELSALAMACGLARVSDAAKITIAHVEKTGPAFKRAGGVVRGSDSAETDESGDLLSWGLMALGLHGDGRALEVVRKAFKRHASNPRVRENAAIALCLIRRRAAAPELIEVLKKGGSRRAKGAIVTALGVLPDADDRTVEALIDVYKHDAMPDNVRAMAIVALGAIGDPRRVPFSAQLMRNYNYFIRSIILDEIASLL